MQAHVHTVKLPFAERAIVDASKLRDYLLSREHPVGVLRRAYSLPPATAKKTGHASSATSSPSRQPWTSNGGRPTSMVSDSSGPVLSSPQTALSCP
jgi:hypothetical protein